MPERTHRDPRPALYDPLWPAWKYLLMVGRHAPGRVHGWMAVETEAVRQPNGDWDYTAAGDRLWSVHGEMLTDEAALAGFVPFWKTKRVPKGPAFDAWASAFLAASRY